MLLGVPDARPRGRLHLRKDAGGALRAPDARGPRRGDLGEALANQEGRVSNSMSQEEILLWMDAVADNWPWLGDHEQQLFMERWWWELLDVLNQLCLDKCPAEWAKRKQTSKD